MTPSQQVTPRGPVAPDHQQAALPEPVACLQPWVDAGMFDTASVEITAAILQLAGGPVPDNHQPDPVVLALALAVRAPLQGSVCVDLSAPPAVPEATDDDGATSEVPPWPEASAWRAALVASSVCREPATTNSPTPTLAPPSMPPAPLVLDDTRVYLQRSWHDELVIAHRLSDLATASNTHGDAGAPEVLVADTHLTEKQRQAIDVALCRNLTVLAGGPGTGKTHTVARMLAALTITSEGPPPVVELVAPTGKAAARLAESIAAAAGGLAQTESLRPVSVALAGYRPRTIHRLLGSRGRAGFTHDARHPLTADVVVVDEASMVSAHLMARLLEALRPDARLVLVGDPDQLTSVEAGAVMADIVRSASTHPGSDLAASVVRLEGSHRFGSDSAIGQLADAIRSGDANMVMALLEAGSSGGGDVQWSDGDLAADHPLVDEVATHARQMVEHSRSADASAAVTHLGGLAVLCANRAGPNGVAAWNTWTELALNGETPSETPSQHWARRHTSGRRRALWYPGRPVMVTANDYVNGLFNGDVGVVVVHNGGRQVAFADDAGGVRLVDTGRLGSVATMWATTIHKSQGSEYDRVVVVLPDHASPLLTRQLLYTAVTRARRQVTVVGSADIVRRAVDTEVARASGLTDRLA